MELSHTLLPANPNRHFDATVTRQLPGVLAALNVVEIPMWVYDIDHHNIAWANPRGLALWDADTLSLLQARDMSVDMSTTVRRRLRQYQEDFHRGISFSESWTFYPNGEPRTYCCHSSGFLLADGRMAMLVQATEQKTETSPTMLRSLQALLHTSVMISLYAWDGALLYSNPAARNVFGTNIKTNYRSIPLTVCAGTNLAYSRA